MTSLSGTGTSVVAAHRVEDADEFLGLVAVLTSPNEDEQTQQRTYVQFRERVKGLGEVAQSLEPVVRLLRLALTG